MDLVPLDPFSSGDGFNKLLCIFIFWVMIYLAGFTAFNDLSFIHDHDTVADIMDHGKVMRNKD